MKIVTVVGARPQFIKAAPLNGAIPLRDAQGIIGIMSHVTLNISLEQVKSLIFQLPARELLELGDIIENRAETVAMMQLAETGFQEWLDEGEDIYAAEA